MENILDIYVSECPANMARVSFDERPCQLIDDVYTPLKMEAGKPERYDCEYKRKGSSCLLLAYDIDTGKRHAQVRKRRTKQDFAEFFDWLEQKYAQVTTLLVVLDNLNTHTIGSFYEYLNLDRAAQLRKKIKFVYTPKHGSWLNMVEIEFSALSRQCLNRRIGNIEELEKQIMPWIEERNEKQIKISWNFTVQKARDQMESKYIKINHNL